MKTEIPITAQYYLPMKDGKTAQMFYRMEKVRWNDGSESMALQYLSECGGGWMNSAENGKNVNDFIAKLIPI